MRRTKVVEERTRGQQALLWGIGFWAERGDELAGALACPASSFVAGMMRGARLLCADMMLAGKHRIAFDYIGYKMGHRPKRSCGGPSVVQSVPGHEGNLSVGCGRCGGALG